MQAYQYSGIDPSGRRITGTMNAPDESSLEEQLRKSGIWLLESSLVHSNTRGVLSTSVRLTPRAPGPLHHELIDFCTLMNCLLQAGVPLVQALEISSQDNSSSGFEILLQDIKRQVEDGVSLHEALSEYPKVFNPHFVALVRASEQSNTLPQGFAELKTHLEWQDRIAADFRKATIYPAISILLVMLCLLALFTWVVPMFATLLTSANGDLPILTRVVLDVSAFFQGTWVFWFSALVFVPLSVGFLKRFWPEFGVWCDRVRFRLPLFGPLLQMLTISVFARSLSALFRAGIPIVQSLNLCEGLVASPLFARILRSVRTNIERGESLSDALRRHPEFPNLLLRLVVSGEKSGSLDAALENTAAYYNLVIPRRIRRIFHVVEPALVAFLVAMIGFVVMALLAPMLGVLENLR